MTLRKVTLRWAAERAGGVVVPPRGEMSKDTKVCVKRIGGLVVDAFCGVERCVVYGQRSLRAWSQSMLEALAQRFSR